ncbi:MAG: ankyrin repeat domain-containing protein [Wolbachia sp.]
MKEVKALLSSGANPNIIAERNQFRGTLIHATSNVKIAKELISYGAMVDGRNMYGETPLHRATIENLKLIRELLTWCWCQCKKPER